MLSELFEQLPEIGDPDKPKLAFFFDEAHLLFNEAPKALVERIELVVRLVRSKGVGVYFVTQNPLDIPDSVLAQLGNRVQHALRAFTPRDQKAVKATATTMRQKPGLDIEAAITELGRRRGAGELPRRQGPPERHRARVRAAAGQPDRPDHAGAAPGADRQFAGGRRLRERPWTASRPTRSSRAAPRRRLMRPPPPASPAPPAAPESGGGMGGLNEMLFGSTGPRGGKRDGLVQTMAKSAVRTMGTTVGKRDPARGAGRDLRRQDQAIACGRAHQRSRRGPIRRPAPPAARCPPRTRPPGTAPPAPCSAGRRPRPRARRRPAPRRPHRPARAASAPGPRAPPAGPTNIGSDITAMLKAQLRQVCPMTSAARSSAGACQRPATAASAHISSTGTASPSHAPPHAHAGPRQPLHDHEAGHGDASAGTAGLTQNIGQNMAWTRSRRRP